MASPDTTASSKSHMGLRVLAIIVALALGALGVGLTAAVIDSWDMPTCDAVNSGEAELPSDGECADTGDTQNSASNVLLLGTSLALVLSAIALFTFGVSGRAVPWLRRTTIMVIAGVALFGVAALVTRI